MRSADTDRDKRADRKIRGKGRIRYLWATPTLRHSHLPNFVGAAAKGDVIFISPKRYVLGLIHPLNARN